MGNGMQRKFMKKQRLNAGQKTITSNWLTTLNYFLKPHVKSLCETYLQDCIAYSKLRLTFLEMHHQDTVWMLVVTMTTLGFGDVVPKAILARAFVGFASVLGIFLMALFISVVHESLQLKQQEKRILATMENAGNLTHSFFLFISIVVAVLLFLFNMTRIDTNIIRIELTSLFVWVSD